MPTGLFFDNPHNDRVAGGQKPKRQRIMQKMKITLTGDAVNDIKKKVADLMDRRHLSLLGAIEALKRDNGIRDLAERLGFGASESEVA